MATRNRNVAHYPGPGLYADIAAIVANRAFGTDYDPVGVVALNLAAYFGTQDPDGFDRDAFLDTVGGWA